jgi:hypothetical protein
MGIVGRHDGSGEEKQDRGERENSNHQCLQEFWTADVDEAGCGGLEYTK